MYIKLTRSERLKDLRINRKLRIEDVASSTGISAATISAYENNDDKDVNLSILEKLSRYYEVPLSYITGESENIEGSLSSVEELHLTDEAVTVLKDGKLNTRLLSEIICHKDFRRLLTDSEIYVDRIVEQNIQNMNAMLEAARQNLLKNDGPDPEDLWMRTLEAAQVEEKDYFSHVLREDLMDVLSDIREAHRTDATTADNTNPTVQMMKAAFDEMSNKTISKEEKLYRSYCRSLKIPYESFSQQEMENFLKVMRSSPVLCKYVGSRNRSYTKPKTHKS